MTRIVHGMEANRNCALEARARPACVWVLDEERVSIRHGASTTLVARRELLSAHSARNVTVIHTRSGDPLRVRQPLGSVLQELDAIGFVRIHRGVAVNLVAVRRLLGRGGHRLSLCLEDGRWLEVGRGFQRDIRARLRGTRP